MNQTPKLTAPQSRIYARVANAYPNLRLRDLYKFRRGETLSIVHLVKTGVLKVGPAPSYFVSVKPNNPYTPKESMTHLRQWYRMATGLDFHH